MNVHEIFNRDRLCDIINRLHFSVDLDPGILVLLRLFAVSLCKIALLYYCSLDVSTMPVILVMSLITIRDGFEDRVFEAKARQP